MELLVNLICIIAVASFSVLAQPNAAQETKTTLPLTYPPQFLQQEGGQICPSETQQKRVRNEIDSAILRLLQESGLLQTQPPTVSTGTYSCGGSTGWRRVAYLNMSDSSQECPSVWQEITTPHRVCGRTSSTGSCEGLTYPTGSVHYVQVCGRITGYQIGLPDSFYRWGSSSMVSIDSFYVDGVSLTYMVLPASTSGHLALVLMKESELLQHASVSLGAVMPLVFLHSSARTISVRQA